MIKMATAIPARKVLGSTFAGALTVILIYIINNAVLGPANPLPAEVAAALTTVVSALVGYYLPPAARDQIEITDTAD